MKTVILACRTLRNEVNLALEKTGAELPVVWLEDNLHDVPHRLRENIQRELDGLSDFRRVLMAFGTCGGAMAGLRTGEFELILPRCDDCLSLLMGSMEHRKAVLDGGFGLFLTEGWMQHERNMASELDRIEKAYPPGRAKRILEVMYGKFDSLNVIDTGAYAVDTILGQSRALARRLGLEHRIQKGTTEYLEQLILGPWPEERFIRISPGTAVTEQDIRLHTS